MPKPLVVTDTAPGLVRRLRQLLDFDAEVERQLRLWNGVMIGCWIGTVVILFFLATSVPFIGLPLGILCLGMAIYATVQYYKFKNEDMENRRLELPLRFLEILGRDIPHKRKCRLNVNFDGYEKHGQLLNQSGNMFTCRLKEYEDHWFSAKGSLCDNTLFRVNILQSVKRKEKSKRKYTKVNERITEKIKLTLRVSPEAYPEWAKLDQLLQQGGVPETEIAYAVSNGTVRIVAVRQPAKRCSNRSGQQTQDEHNLTSGDTLLQLFMYVYAQLQHCRGANIQSGANV